MRTERLGSLNARITGGSDGNGAGQGPVVVLMHGFGAPGSDLVPLGRALGASSDVRFVFPEAPLQLDPFGSRAWWMIDPEIFERRARGEVIDRSEDQPAELPHVRAQVLDLLDSVYTKLDAAPERLILGGFSQGSMLALDVALHLSHKPAGLALLSSTLIARPVWEPKFSSLAGMPIVQSHGREDPLLAFSAAETLRDLLTAGRASVNFVPFSGGHEIPPPVLSALSELIASVPG